MRSERKKMNRRKKIKVRNPNNQKTKTKTNKQIKNTIRQNQESQSNKQRKVMKFLWYPQFCGSIQVGFQKCAVQFCQVCSRICVGCGVDIGF